MHFKIQPHVRVQVIVAACLNLGELINWYGIAWTAPVLPKLDGDQSPLSHKVTDAQKTWIICITYFGFFGAYIGGFLSNKIGRKWSLVVGGVLNLISHIVMMAARNLAMIYVGRFLLGISLSWLSITDLIYIGEITSPNLRGIFLTCMGVFQAMGSLLVYCVGPFVDYVTVSYVAIGLNMVYILACNFLPESPMFYVIKNNEKAASAALQYLGRSVDIDTELKTMMMKAQERKKIKHILRELFTIKCNRKSLFITVCLSAFQQTCGIVTLIFYANTIFKYAGSSIQPDIATIIVGVIFVLGAIGAPMFIEKYGRKILLIVSTAGLSVIMAVIGGYFYLRIKEPASVENLGWLPLTVFVLAQLTYSIGMCIVPNTLSGELFTAKVRVLGPSISLCSGWISGFLTTTIYGYVVASMGIYVIFWMFAVSNALAFMFVVLFVPETMGKSLTEIEDMLDT